MTRDYLLASLERAIKTACQTFLALVGTDATGITDLDWIALASAVALATLISAVTSLAGVKLTPGDGPAAFGPEAVKAPYPGDAEVEEVAEGAAEESNNGTSGDRTPDPGPGGPAA